MALRFRPADPARQRPVYVHEKFSRLQRGDERIARPGLASIQSNTFRYAKRLDARGMRCLRRGRQKRRGRGRELGDGEIGSAIDARDASAITASATAKPCRWFPLPRRQGAGSNVVARRLSGARLA